MSTYTPIAAISEVKGKAQRSTCPECYPHLTLSDAPDVIPITYEILQVFVCAKFQLLRAAETSRLKPFGYPQGKRRTLRKKSLVGGHRPRQRIGHIRVKQAVKQMFAGFAAQRETSRNISAGR